MYWFAAWEWSRGTRKPTTFGSPNRKSGLFVCFKASCGSTFFLLHLSLIKHSTEGRLSRTLYANAFSQIKAWIEERLIATLWGWDVFREGWLFVCTTCTHSSSEGHLFSIFLSWLANQGDFLGRMTIAALSIIGSFLVNSFDLSWGEANSMNQYTVPPSMNFSQWKNCCMPFDK